MYSSNSSTCSGWENAHFWGFSNVDEFKYKVAVQGRFDENISKHVRLICDAFMYILAKKAKH